MGGGGGGGCTPIGDTKKVKESENLKTILVFQLLLAGSVYSTRRSAVGISPCAMYKGYILAVKRFNFHFTGGTVSNFPQQSGLLFECLKLYLKLF